MGALVVEPPVEDVVLVFVVVLAEHHHRFVVQPQQRPAVEALQDSLNRLKNQTNKYILPTFSKSLPPNSPCMLGRTL